MIISRVIYSQMPVKTILFSDEEFELFAISLSYRGCFKVAFDCSCLELVPNQLLASNQLQA